MKLAVWAREQGLTYKTAYKLFRNGQLPMQSEQLVTGTILLYPQAPVSRKVVLYARVSSHDQQADLDRQMKRLRSFAAASGWTIGQEVCEIWSGLNATRKKLLQLLRDCTVTDIVVEHRDRLSRFGFEMLEASLASQQRRLIVMNEGECQDDLVRDFTDVVTCLCARIYGKRSAHNRARRALEATKHED